MSEFGKPIELLDSASIIAGMNPGISEKLTSVKIESCLNSTNTALQRLPVEEQHAAVILAEQQTMGRGRRGRQWHSPYGRNLYLSLGWRFEKALSELGCLPLVVALATARALTRAGLSGQRIKWPNDILLDGRKLCGCLVEMQTDAQGLSYAVLGVGINVDMPASEVEGEIDQPWTDLHSQLPGCSRNALAALLLEELLGNLEIFVQQGFAPFRADWQQMDGLQGQTIEVFAGNISHKGVSKGVDDRGALLLDTGKEVLSLHSGEVSLSKIKTGL